MSDTIFPPQREAPREAPPVADQPDRPLLNDWRVIGAGGRRYAVRRHTNAGQDPEDLVAFAAPRLAVSQNGRPVFSMTALLRDQPPPEDTFIAPHVEAAQIALDATCAMTPTEMTELSGVLGQEVSALVPSETRFILVESGAEVANALVAGSGGRAGLSARVSRDCALQVMDAMNGIVPAEDGALVLSARARVCTRSRPLRVRLQGRWADVWHALHARQDAEGRISRADVDPTIRYLIGDGTLRLIGPDGETLSDLEVAVSLFGRVRGFLLSEDPFGYLMLRERPAESFPLDISETRTIAGTEDIALETALGPAIAAALRDLPLEGALHFVALTGAGTGDGGAPVSEPRRTVSRRAGAAAAHGKPAAYSIVGASLVDSDRLTRPTVKPTVVSHARPLALGTATLVRPRPETEPRPRNLPIVTDAEAAAMTTLFQDRTSGRVRWYAPDFAPATPARGAKSDDSAFHFSFERVGTTGSGAPALRASLAFRLEAQPPSEVEEAIERLRGEGIEIRATPVREPVVHLEIPYIDDASGDLRMQRFACDVAPSGSDLDCTVSLNNDWVRLAYGALSTPGFQERTPRVLVGYSVETYAPVDARKGGSVAGGKVRRIGDLKTSAQALTVSRPQGTVSLRRRMGAARANLSGVATVAASDRPLVSSNTVAALSVRPTLELSPSVLAALSRTLYAERIRTVTRAAEIVVPCRDHPAAYVERRDGTARAVGCQDALQLGRAENRMFEEIVSLASDSATIHRSLQQPDVFLVAPARYRLTRVAGDDGVVPAVALYSVLDPESAGNTRFVFDFTLQPDLSPDQRRQLLLDLAPFSPEPVLRYPAEFDVRSVECALLARGEVEHSADGAFLRFSVSCAQGDALLFKSQLEGRGLNGSVRYVFADGSSVNATLDPGLRSITGPWDTGPVDASVDGHSIRLRNLTESPHEVSEVLCLSPFARVPAGLRLEPGATGSVATTDDHAEAFAVAARIDNGPADLTEIRSFVEDVRQSVIFFAEFDFAAADIQRVEVEAEIEGSGDRRTVTLDADHAAEEVVFSLPLTRLLSDARLRYSVVRISGDGKSLTSPDRSVALSEGALIIISTDGPS